MNTNQSIPPRSYDPEKMIGGLAVLIVGAIFLLNQLDWLDIGDAWAYWPVMLIAFGIAKLMSRNPKHRGSGGWLLAIGAWFLIGNLGLFGLSIGTSWPILLIIVGISMLWRSVFSGRPEKEANRNAEQS